MTIGDVGNDCLCVVITEIYSVLISKDNTRMIYRGMAMTGREPWMGGMDNRENRQMRSSGLSSH
jgi:hypothetical protein